MPTRRKSETIFMAEGEHSHLNGASIVKVTILGLMLTLVGRKLGIALSVTGFVVATGLAALLYAVWRCVKSVLAGRDRQSN